MFPEIKDASPDVRFIKQTQTNWCWAACCESFAAYYNKGIKSQHEFLLLIGQGAQFQTEFALHAHGGPVPLNLTAQPNQFYKLLAEIMGLQTAEVLSHQYAAGGIPDHRYTREQMMGALSQGRIFIVGAGGHYMLLCGYDDTQKKLKYMDPFLGRIIHEGWESYTKSDTMVWLAKPTHSRLKTT